MSQLERLQKINLMLTDNKLVSTEQFIAELEVSKATFKRDLEKLRNAFNAPIVFDRFSNGYKFDEPNAGKRYELPGLWFSEQEARSLVITQHLLGSLDPGSLVSAQLSPITSRIDALLGKGEVSSAELRKRFRVIGMGTRKSAITNFAPIGAALLSRDRLVIRYLAKSTLESTEREISPQRLIFYRDNWYLDAYCHLRESLRSFALDAIESISLSPQKALDMKDSELNTFFADSYGIFNGPATQKVTLRFTAERARWVANETWHPKQTSSFNKDGHYTIEFDFNQDPELIMDILKHGSHVQVVQPSSLALKVQKELEKALKNYTDQDKKPIN